jgi:hypothetical protein
VLWLAQGQGSATGTVRVVKMELMVSGEEDLQDDGAISHFVVISTLLGRLQSRSGLTPCAIVANCGRVEQQQRQQHTVRPFFERVCFRAVFGALVLQH